MKEIIHEFTSKIVCPYCGHEFENSHEFGNDGMIDCECGHVFTFEKNIQITYTSYTYETAEDHEIAHATAMGDEGV